MLLLVNLVSQLLLVPLHCQANASIAAVAEARLFLRLRLSVVAESELAHVQTVICSLWELLAADKY